MEPHTILSNQAVLRKKNKVRGRHQTLSFQNILQSYSNQEYAIGNNILLFGSDTKITGEKVELDDWDRTNSSKQSASWKGSKWKRRTYFANGISYEGVLS